MFKRIIVKILVNALALFLVDKVLSGIEIASFGVAVWAALLLGVFNITIKPIVSFLALPITFLTLGLFSFVINGAFFLLVSSLIDGFHVNGFFTAIIAAMLMGIINSLIHSILDKKYR